MGALFFFFDFGSVAGATIVGTWGDVLHIYSGNKRIQCHSANKRINL